jgi:molecular chaperone GrpE
MEDVKVTTELSIEEKLVETEDKYLRLMAEFENYKRRVQKEKEELITNTKTKMISSILDLDSDLAIAKKNMGNNEGLNLIMSKMEKYLISQGIEPIQTETYDSDIHEVISVMEIGEKRIIDVVKKGYLLNGKPIRFPQIILGK